jgi:hypothetical protein
MSCERRQFAFRVSRDVDLGRDHFVRRAEIVWDADLFNVFP